MTDHATVQAEEREARELHRRLDRARRIKRKRAAQRQRQRPRRIKEVERQMEVLGRTIRETPIGERYPLYAELRELANERLDLKWEA